MSKRQIVPGGGCLKLFPGDVVVATRGLRDFFTSRVMVPEGSLGVIESGCGCCEEEGTVHVMWPEVLGRNHITQAPLDGLGLYVPLESVAALNHFLRTRGRPDA